MITASCLFCEDVRREASGQEAWIGIFNTAIARLDERVSGRFFALVTIHVPFDCAGTTFSIRVVDGAGREDISGPSVDELSRAIENSAQFGFKIACLTASIDLKDFLTGDLVSTVRVFLQAAGEETLIGSFSAGEHAEAG